ncbi:MULTISPECIES: CDP-diacylglycerol--glycerol-3-phosphate 3-phosphatidyltransferase [unclassified Eubacterium (in: firmicutes)]|uniref:CDP-diacylglycerol--glycerol-3-phosphate 3-phosphatidyltransferase n=1 Tax=Eubacterium TaxID=1730 RepID=UPI000E5474B3|nr:MULTISPECIES: CDP-diacylglycerol--glycerol-3-phosphate 3-phosphatidyltransferase [unclassified Eubacterium (in: firmicutes)]RGF50975.1 CDP-diacylglycerol--glycerol-3-phosphate 3-phosphatidyltransferase [Eubacterium sp. AF36-5BH]RHP21706.1 CDP-diacylglycerol--glycerol-3-phosphate 3-phosphatidyltransferase [Eubacterium sp. AF34-35BH]
MNLANKLTTFRVLCIPIFVVFMLIESISYNYYLAAIVFIVASITDLFDGKIARKYHLVTNFGKFMDPLADKMLVSAALICLTPKMIPSWVVIIIISRELFISGFRMLAADQGIVLAAGWWGKFKTAFSMVMIIVLIVNTPLNNSVLYIIGQILIWISLALTIISMIEYVSKNFNVLKN